MISVLVDCNIEGQAMMLWRQMNSDGWLELYPLKFVTLHQTDLPYNSPDTEVWRFAQKNRMILLTANRRMKSEDSLEQTIRKESTSTSLPVLTIANVNRMTERLYREKCMIRLMEIVIYLDNYLGSERIFIP